MENDPTKIPEDELEALLELDEDLLVAYLEGNLPTEEDVARLRKLSQDEPNSQGETK